MTVATSQDAGGMRLAGRTAIILPVMLGAGLLLAFALSPARLAPAMPLLVLALAVAGFRAGPLPYLGVVLTVFTLAPLARRLADLEVGQFSQVSPIMIAPSVALIPAMVAGFAGSGLLLRPHFRPLVAMLAGTTLSALAGFAAGAGAAAVFALVQWVGAVGLALWLAQGWQPAHAAPAAKGMAILLAGVSLYGCAQFVQPLEWDRFWMLAVPMNSIGQPEPYSVRVFSTLNAPLPAALWLTAAALFLIARPVTFLSGIALALGLACLGLTLVRAAWGCFAVGLALLAWRGVLPKATLMLAAAGCVAAAVLAGGTLSARFAGLAALDDDISMTERIAFHHDMIGEALSRPFGIGLGSTGQATRLAGSDGTLGRYGDFDSGLMAMALEGGWLAGGLMLAGLLGLAWQAIRYVPGCRRGGGAAAAAIVVAMVAQLPLASLSGLSLALLLGASGVMSAEQKS